MICIKSFWIHCKLREVLFHRGCINSINSIHNNCTALIATCAPAFIVFKSGGDKQKQSYNYKGKSLFKLCFSVFCIMSVKPFFLFIYLVNDRFLDIQYQYVFKSTSLRKRTFAWTKSFSHIHVANLKSTVNLISMYLNCGRKLWKEPMQMWVQPHLHGFQSQGCLAVRRWF